MVNDEVDKLMEENTSLQEKCEFCNEVSLKVGEKTRYNSIIIYKVGDSNEDGWFATLSPRTGGDPKSDFTIQLMPFGHFTHFSQVNNSPKLAENYGVAFSKLSYAIAKVMAEDPKMKSNARTREEGIAIASYGKCTTWKEKKEHLHIKIFQFRNDLGQPATVDSSFGRKEIIKDQKTDEEFIKMKPVRKKMIDEQRFDELSKKLLLLLK